MAAASTIPTYVGDWRIESEVLGSGSDAIVCLAYHVHTNQRAAVKIIDVAGKSQVRERAWAEARILERLTRKGAQALPVTLSTSPYYSSTPTSASSTPPAAAALAAVGSLGDDPMMGAHGHHNHHSHLHQPPAAATAAAAAAAVHHHHHGHHHGHSHRGQQQQDQLDLEDMMMDDGFYGHHHALPHHHVVSFLAVEEDPQHVYLFTEYAPRGDLATFIHRNGRLEEDEARKYLRQMVRALEFCHDSGITHHDFKLENLLLGADRNIRLIDFGLAKSTDHGTMIVDHFAGSPLYMPPEIFSLQPHDASVDVWSLGVCLYYMVTDTFPFAADSYTELEEKVLFDDVTFPVNMGLSDNLQDLLRRLLVKDPLRRIRVHDIRLHSWWTSSRYNSGFAGDRYEEEVSLPPLPVSSLPSSAASSSWASPPFGSAPASAASSGIRILGSGGVGGGGVGTSTPTGSVGASPHMPGAGASAGSSSTPGTPIATSPFAFRPFF